MDIKLSYDEEGNLLITPTVTAEDLKEVHEMDPFQRWEYVRESFFDNHDFRIVDEEEKAFLGDLTSAPIITDILDYMSDNMEDWNDFSYYYPNFVSCIWEDELLEGKIVTFLKRGNYT